MAVSKVGNLVRLFESPIKIEEWSALEWWLVLKKETEDSYRIRRQTGMELVVNPLQFGKEYNFREFELASAEDLAEHLVLLNLKMDITNTPTAQTLSENQMETWAKKMAGYAAAALPSATTPGTFVPMPYGPPTTTTTATGVGMAVPVTMSYGGTTNPYSITVSAAQEVLFNKLTGKTTK